VLENAIKYSPAGGLIEVTAGRRGRRVEVVVTDPGVGPPASWGRQRRIFQVLSQSEKPQGRVHDEGGVGMGLFITSQLLTRMGGSIRAVPHRPNGAEFHLRFVATGSG
jgi:signal transduction histidine kinase